jgi:hypothetical protein
VPGTAHAAFAAAVHRAQAWTQARGLHLQAPVVRLDREFDAPQLALLREVAPLTMTPPHRVLAFCDAVDYVVRGGIPGAVVECGVWRGGSMVAAARTLLAAQAADRDLWLYDTFAGMTEPGAHDRTADGRRADTWIAAERTRDGATSGVFEATLDDVRAVLRATGYPDERMRFEVGRVEDTLTGPDLPEQIAVLRLDTDFYESTRLELDVLFPRLSPGGVLLIDDYGYWMGARRAVDEYFAGRPELLVRVDSSARLVIKRHRSGTGR